MLSLAFTEYEAFAQAVRDASMTMRLTCVEESNGRCNLRQSAPFTFSAASKGWQHCRGGHWQRGVDVLPSIASSPRQWAKLISR